MADFLFSKSHRFNHNGNNVLWQSPLDPRVSQPATPFFYTIRNNRLPAVLDLNNRVLWEPADTSFAARGRICRFGNKARDRLLEHSHEPMTVGQYLVSSHDYRLIIVDRGFNLCFNLQFYIFF